MEATNEVCREEYRRIGLSGRQIELIKTSIPKRHYYYTSPYGKRLFELGLGNVAKCFTTASSKEQIKLVDSLIDTYGESWPAEWLKYNGHNEWAEAWKLFK
jgi:type IV secretion system protein VirB4